MRPYILALDMSHFKYDDFIRVLDIVNRYMYIVCMYIAPTCSIIISALLQVEFYLVPHIVCCMYVHVCLYIHVGRCYCVFCALVCRLITIGVEFCGEGSSSLQESMRQQSLNYFKNYHR